MPQLPRSFQYRPPVLAERRGGVLLRGLAIALSNWRCLTWLWFLNMTLAWLATTAFATQLHSAFDHSFMADRLQNSVDVAALINFGMRHPEAASSSGSIAFLLDGVFVLLMFIATPGILACYMGDEISSLGNMFRAGLRFFWRFVRFGLVAALIAGVVLGGLEFLRFAMIKGMTAHAATKFNFWFTGITAVLLLAAAVVFRLWFDLSEICIVDRGAYRLGRAEDRRAVRTLRPGMQLLKRGFWRLYISFSAIGLLGWAGLLVCLELWRLMPAYAPLRSTILWQLGLFLLLASRMWQRGMEVAWFEREGAFLTAVADPLPAPPVAEVNYSAEPGGAAANDPLPA